MPCKTQPTITAHRGGALLWTENSMEAHTNILSLDVDCIECDIHASADGRLVVFHDNALERLTENGRGDIAEHSFEHLRTLKLKHTRKDTIFPLETFFTLHANTNYALQVELKPRSDGHAYPNMVKSFVKLVKDYNYETRVVPISFSLVYLKQLQEHGFCPATTQLLLPEYAHRVLGMQALLDMVHTHDIAVVGGHVESFTHAEVDALQAQHVRTSVWGANNEESIRHALSLPLVNISSDRPDLALALRASLSVGELPPHPLG